MVKEMSLDEAQKFLKRAEDLKKKQDDELAKATKMYAAAKEREFLTTVGKGGEEVRVQVDKFLEHRKSANEISERIQAQLKELETVKDYIVTQYDPIMKTLIGLGMKESDLPEFLGEPPKLKATKAPAAGSTTSKKHFKLYDPQNVQHKWVDYGLTLGLTELELKGGEKGGVNARLVVMKKLDGKLPAGWKIVEE